MKIIDKSSYKLPTRVRNVLLIQLGDIGDVVWTTPSIQATKNSIPHSRVSVMVKDGFGSLLEADPSIERIFEVKSYHGSLFHQAAGQLSFLKDIRSRHFDLAVDLRLGDRGAFMAFATGAPLRVTLHHPGGVPFWRNYLFTHGVVPHAPVHAQGAAEQSLGILRGLGIDTDDLIPRLWITDAVKKRVREILVREKVDGDKSWITINPFSRWSYKEWASDKWIEIINWLWKDFAIPLIVIGSAEEQPKAEALIRQCEAVTFNLAGKTTLAELTGLLSLSRLHIGVDSAAPHIAAAVGTPTMTIYGPSSWKDWAPPGKNHRVILPQMDCVPCHQKGCDGSGHSRCLDELTVDQVKNAIRETMENQKMVLSQD
jgi:predicted lipopolysaccharide heptosyltransferase III